MKPTTLENDKLPVGKISQLNNAPSVPKDFVSPKTYPVNSTAVAELFDRADRPAPEGEINRKTLTFTITPQTDQEWRDFLQTYTGTLPQRGKGISSPMVELSMQLLMAIIASFRLDEVAASLAEVSASDAARQQLKANLVDLAERL